MSYNNTTFDSEIQPFTTPVTTSHEVALYGAIGYSVVAMIANVVAYNYVKNTYNEKAPYQILRSECLITSFCQLGRIGIIGHNLSSASCSAVCIVATTTFQTNMLMLIGTRFYISRVR